MDSNFVAILQKLVAEQEKQIFLENKKCISVLADYSQNEYKKENKLLALAINSGVAKAIIEASDFELCRKQQIRILQEEHFWIDEIAMDVIDTLAFVLRGNIQKKEILPESADEQFELANNYWNNKDMEKAVYWWTKAAEQGHAIALFNIGVCFANGFSLPQDKEKSLYWFSKSAEQNYSQAQYVLGVNYEYGEGVRRNMKNAIYWYSKAAEQGYAEAQYKLGVCYYNAYGVQQSKEKANYWYAKAYEQGYAERQKTYQDSWGKEVIGDVCPEGYNRVPALGAPPTILFFDDKEKYQSFLAEFHRNITEVGYWGMNNEKNKPKKLGEHLAHIDYCSNPNTAIASVFIYHNEKNRVSFLADDMHNVYSAEYCLGEKGK